MKLKLIVETYGKDQKQPRFSFNKILYRIKGFPGNIVNAIQDGPY